MYKNNLLIFIYFSIFPLLSFPNIFHSIFQKSNIIL